MQPWRVARVGRPPHDRIVALGEGCIAARSRPAAAYSGAAWYSPLCCYAMSDRPAHGPIGNGCPQCRHYMV
jgi:hypothetical protein